MPRVTQIRGGMAMEPGLPSWRDQAGNLVRAAGRVARAVVRREPVIVPPEVKAIRRALCQVCPRFRPSDGRCSLCGCGTSGIILDKLQFATEQCPERRWLRWTAG